jgi:hypothetical protein
MFTVSHFSSAHNIEAKHTSSHGTKTNQGNIFILNRMLKTNPFILVFAAGVDLEKGMI